MCYLVTSEQTCEESVCFVSMEVGGLFLGDVYSAAIRDPLLVRPDPRPEGSHMISCLDHLSRLGDQHLVEVVS